MISIEQIGEGRWEIWSDDREGIEVRRKLLCEVRASPDGIEFRGERDASVLPWLKFIHFSIPVLGERANDCSHDALLEA